MYVKDRHLDTHTQPPPICTLLNPIGRGERKWIEMMRKLVFMSADSSLCCTKWRKRGTFYVYIFLFPPHHHHHRSPYPPLLYVGEEGQHRCLNFLGSGDWFVYCGKSVGWVFLFPVSHLFCSLSDHFLLLSVHKYNNNKKKYICINF